MCVSLSVGVCYLCGLDELIDEVDSMLTAVWLTHHHGNTLWTDAIIWREVRGQSVQQPLIWIILV